MVNKSLKNKGFYYWFTTIVFMLSILVVHVGSALSDADIGHSSSPLEVAHICLTISSNPEGADIYFDGKNIGKTPMDYVITDSTTHEILLELSGYDNLKVEYNSKEDTNNKIEASLNKKKTIILNQIDTERINSYKLDTEGIKSNKLETVELKLSNIQTNESTSSTTQSEGVTPPTKGFKPLINTAHASLSINSKPEGADIYFDGENIGKTPMDYAITDLKIHEIRLELDGYYSWEEKYNRSLDSNQIEVSLNKIKDKTPSTTETEGISPSATRTDEITPPATETEKITPSTTEAEGIAPVPTEAPHMSLSINSNPEGADIYFDGKNIGNTPMDYGITDLKIHDICLKLEGYDSWKEKYNPSLDSNKIKVSLNKMKDLTPSITETEEMKSLSIKDENIKPNSPGKTEIASNPPEEGPDFLGVSSLAILLCGYLIMRYKK
jgi:hypothetical protein